MSTEMSVEISDYDGAVISLEREECPEVERKVGGPALFCRTAGDGFCLDREAAEEVYVALGKWLEENPREPQEMQIQLSEVAHGEEFTLYGVTWRRYDRNLPGTHRNRIDAVRVDDDNFVVGLHEWSKVTVIR